MNRVNSLRKDAPELLENQEVFDLAAQADQLQELKALADMEGGKQLIKLLIKDVVFKVNQLQASYRTASHIELLAIISEMSAHLNTAKLLINSKENIELLDKELAESLSE